LLIIAMSGPLAAGWAIGSPVDGLAYGRYQNIQTNGRGGGSQLQFTIAIKNPAGAIVRDELGKTGITQPFHWTETLFNPLGGWQPPGTGWTIELFANGESQDSVSIEIVGGG